MRLARLAFIVSIAACSEKNTSGTRVTLHTAIASSTSFTTEAGWAVALDNVTVSVGPLYYFDGAPVIARAKRRSGFRDWFSIREAWAHPGHYQEGNAMGQMLTPTSTVVTSTPTQLGDGEGVTGPYRSGRWTFGTPPAGPAAGALGSAVVLLSGTATKGSETRSFKLVGEPTDTLDVAGKPEVEGCVFEETHVSSEGTVTALLQPNIWVNQIDFSELPTGAATQPVDRSTRAFKEFARALKNGSAIIFKFAKK